MINVDEKTLNEFSANQRLIREDLNQLLVAHREYIASEGKEGKKLILSNANLEGVFLEGADLKEVDLRKANLQNANLKETFLLGTQFNEANLQDADLTNAKGLLASQIAGANVCGAKLPEDIEKFEGLKYVAESSQHAQKLFFTMLLACVYCWLTIVTTKDAALLTNSISSSLPVIGTSIPIVGFYWAAPLLLVCTYLYFHIYLQRLWESLAGLPAIFPDGKPLPQRAYPWLLIGFVWAYFSLLKFMRPQLSRLQNFLSIILAWWFVPLTLLFFWLRYLRAHDWPTTYLHIALLALVAGCAVGFSSLTARTLNPSRDKMPFWHRALQTFRVSERGIVVLGTLVFGIIISLFSYGAIEGINPNPDRGPFQVAYTNTNLRSLVPWAMSCLGYSPFALLMDAELSIKPHNWTRGGEEEIAAVKGAMLHGKNL